MNTPNQTCTDIEQCGFGPAHNREPCGVQCMRAKMKSVCVRMKSVLFIAELLVCVNSNVVGCALISIPDVSAADATLVQILYTVLVWITL